MPVPVKPHPGYPGHGPPLPGKDFASHGVSARTPPGTEKYYPQWSGDNIRSNQVAESERLAAERLLKETKDLIADTRRALGEFAKCRICEFCVGKIELRVSGKSGLAMKIV